MIPSLPEADLFVPDDPFAGPSQALARTTHLCVGAHPDDVEIMAHDAITACYGAADLSFTAVVVTDGAGSARTGPYAGTSDDELVAIRRHEQRQAATVGRYGLLVQLAHPSASLKDPANRDVRADLAALFAGCRPRVVYLHNPADKHDTHVAVFLRCLEALRALPADARPARVLGVEGWRNLDWLGDDEKVALDCSARPHLASALIGVFDSQIAGGKRYDLAMAARRLANATYHHSHEPDGPAAVTFAMDLTPLVHQPGLDVADWTLAAIDRFRHDAATRLARLR